MQGQQNAIDFLKDNLQAVNKRKYLETVKHQLTVNNEPQQQQQQKMQTQQQLSSVLEPYQDCYLKFMYKDTLMTNSKSNGLIDQCLEKVHAGLKTKKDCKYILSIMTKIYVQELIEQSLQVLEEYKLANLEQRKANNIHIGTSSKPKRPQQIDIDVIEQAYRRRLIKKEKL